MIESIINTGSATSHISLYLVSSTEITGPKEHSDKGKSIFYSWWKKKTTVKSWLQGFVVAEIYSLNNAKLCQKVQQKFKIYVHKWTNSGNVEEKYKEINFKYATTLLICKLIFWLVHFKMYVITVIKSMKQKSSFLNKQMQFPGNCYKRWFNTYCEQTSRRVCMKER